jgi:class 3 adenylate cyclase
MQRPDLAREQFNRARDVLEAQGPSEALAIAYIRLSGLASFDRGAGAGLDDARRAAEIAEQAGSGLALAWSWNFVALAEMGLGQVDAGFRHLEESFQAARKGDYYFQTGNAVYNGAWLSVHLGRGHEAAKWLERATTIWSGRSESWPIYIEALVTLQQGHVDRAVELFRSASVRARDTGNVKNVWRSSVGLAHALAENLHPEDAAAELPPVSSRVEGQDSMYDTAARVRTRLAAGDPEGAFESARLISPDIADLASPADVVAEAAAAHPEWLRSFVEALPVRGEVVESPRAAAARGRLALYENRYEDALRELGAAEARFREGALMLDVWHVGRALAEAEALSGKRDEARDRLSGIASQARASGARLAAKLARDTAGRLALEIAPEPEIPADGERAEPVTTGERMVSVLFADVRGYSEMSGRNTPADMADRIASLQRWASQEVARRRGLVDKFAGDAVMATFNVSGQSVDHTLQALQAAIAIIDKASLAGLPVGAGIAVGPAVVGTLAESANVSVLGEVTNLAARLQAASPAGEVTLSQEAHRRVEDWIKERGLAAERVELELKGFGAPVVAYRVAASVPLPL